MIGVWAKGLRKQKNIELLFLAKLKNIYGNVFIKLVGSTVFRVFNNGELLGYGPIRVAEGYAAINNFKTELNGDNFIAVEVVSYQINSFAYLKQPPFFGIEIIKDNKIIFDSLDFRCYHNTSRIQKVERYSFQRNFLEYYKYLQNPSEIRMGKVPYQEKETEKVFLPSLLEVEVSHASLTPMKLANILDFGELKERTEYYQEIIPEYAQVGPYCEGYKTEELEACLSEEAAKLAFVSEGIENKSTLNDEYLLFELNVEKTGWLNLEVYSEKESELFLIFDEIILGDEERKLITGSKYFEGDPYPILFHRTTSINVLKYKIGIGSYQLTSFEPYSFKYLKVCVKGNITLLKAELLLAENKNIKVYLDINDKTLQSIFDSAINNFSQNVLDIFMDCPSRERAGWLCDSFFMGRAEYLITGKNTTEKHFLTNYLYAPPVKKLPQAMLPMCYPADFLDGIYIPNWAMWFVIELKDYYLRSNDHDLVRKLQPKIENLIKFFEKYENSDGLLEKLEKWIFVEWSDSNKYVQDVNYPTNMLYAKMLNDAAFLYSNDNYKEKSLKIRSKIIEDAFDGLFFRDHAIRVDGKLIVQPNITETCQYYALFTGVSQGAAFEEHKKMMYEKYGFQRKKDAKDISRSNAFIGNFLRLECLMQDGLYNQAIFEFIDYFGYMAKRTGTLWEDMKPTVSCNHGFASYVANWIVTAVFGYLGRDDIRKELYFIAVKNDYSGRVAIPIINDFLYLEKNRESVKIETNLDYKVIYKNL